MNPNFFDLKIQKKSDLLFELLLGNLESGMVTRKEIRSIDRLIKGLEAKKSEPACLNNQFQRTKIVTAGENIGNEAKK